MRNVTATTRFTIGLVCLALSVWLIAFALGMFPDRQTAVTEGRVALSENVALQCSLLASRNDRGTMENALRGLVQRNKDVRSAAIRLPDNSLLLSVGPHTGHWSLSPESKSIASQMRVPILAGDSEWGTVELRFSPKSSSGLFRGWLAHPIVILIAFVAAATYLLYYYYLRKMLQHLDPSRVIPRRVRQTLDTLVEGLLVLDKNERILLANSSFAECVGMSVDELVGRKASELPWQEKLGVEQESGYAWQRAMTDDTPQLGDRLTVSGSDKKRRVLRVSAVPICGDDGQQRGAMASFDDVTENEKSREQLQEMLESLSESRDETRRQNLELERLAARDSLTDCLNRRAFFIELENYWAIASRHDQPMSCVMIDLDFFKSINDTHGHQKGDLVLQKTAELLRAGHESNLLVCRYGGEEFCVLLPYIDLHEASDVAEQLRASVEEADFEGLRVTCSIGLSASSLNAKDPHELIGQADSALYMAKRDGRNRVLGFDEVLLRGEEAVADESQVADGENSVPVPEPTIPFHAVTALVSALAYRDAATADHSRRVADLCVEAARRLMPTKASYTLEIAALLHDVGKIGVPDSILLKPDKLTEAEWQVMNLHERIGTEIVQSAFSNPKLTEIIRTYRAWFGGNPKLPGLPVGNDIPLEARILAIADAFDSMTHRTAYREPMSVDEASTELRRSTVRQFDPDLVEQFIDTIAATASVATAENVESSKSAALNFGAQIERLSDALDNHDFAGIAAMAHRLNDTAIKHDSPAVAEVAKRLEVAASSSEEFQDVVQLTGELIHLCRSVQRAYIDAHSRVEVGARADGLQ